MPKVGIPRALFFYEYYPLWKTFFEELGAEIIVSDKTTKTILDIGTKSCVDEACLPVKLFFGHVISLKERVDYIFIPRMVSVSSMEYICPKFAGLPDMVRNLIKNLPQIIDTEINLRNSKHDIYRSIIEIGSSFTKNRKKIIKAFDKAIIEYNKFIHKMMQGIMPEEIFSGLKKQCMHENRLNIAVIGHAYNIYDSYVSMKLIDKLEKMGANVMTIEMAEEKEINVKAEKLIKPMFWTFGRKALGFALNLIDRKDIDGIIYVMSFGCGVDAFVCDLAERYVRRDRNIPFTVLTIDEHTGEAGMNTRIEAFIDMIIWRKDYENNISAYGKCISDSKNII